MDLNKSPYQDQKLQHNNDKTKRPGYPCIRISVNQCMVKKDPPVISDPRFSLAARSGGNRLKRIFLFKSILGQWTKKDLFIQIDSKTMCIAVTGSGGLLGGALCRGCDENGPIPHDRLEIDCTVCSFLSSFFFFF